ncbi:uncharacterized protein LOC109716178 [Ananas comosus]|uniref:Uncharacterized protein LOC109716178 n=1 Tax=Ananas comosus TaxID=4615 RepID=A0A6P5FLB3_ANACO|nr:uncharacterized protein LOC109716178 [Ananas comosus]XP_020097091.1 uncharacterized protein LOC109716178 [Ananas comosus]XP_020097092.1 uncharacterized protein LOC109716178 [Ananas comosus]
MAPVVFPICFRELLRDVCQKYSLSMPMYGVPVENEKGAIRVYGEVELVRGDTVTEAVRCWSAPCANVDESEEDAARRCVGKLHDEFSFDVRDFNLEDKKCFEDLYGRLSIENEIVKKKYKRVKKDYRLLWGYYNDLLTEKKWYVTERIGLKKMIVACGDLLDRPNAVALDQNGNADDSEEDPVAPPGYGTFRS